MTRRLYVVEVREPGGEWAPTTIAEFEVNDAKAEAYSLLRACASVRVVAYAPHGERVSARPLLVLRAKKRA